MNYRDIELFKALGPILTFMKIFGLYHNKREHNTVNCEVLNKRKWKCPSFTKSQCYCIFVLLLTICNCIETVTFFNKSETFGTLLFVKITTLLYYLHTACNLISFYWISEVLPNFCIEWKKLQEVFKNNSSGVSGLRRQIICAVIFIIINAMGSLPTIAYVCFSDNKVFKASRNEESSVIWDNVIKTTRTIAMFHTNVVWILSVIFILITSKSHSKNQQSKSTVRTNN